MVIRSLRIQATLLGFILLTLSYTVAFAKIQADTTFGLNGIVIKDFGIGHDEALSLAVQDDKNILVAGYAYNGSVKNLVVARYLPDGSLDTSFSTAGIFGASFGNGDTVANNIIIQSDGTILISGIAEDADSNVFVARLTPEGNLDNSFGDNGKSRVVVVGDEVQNTDVVTADDGSIYVVNTFSDAGGSNNSNILKFTPDGTLDATLEIDEAVHIRAISLLSGGKIFAAGYGEENGENSASLMRFNDDGSVDDTFGTNGILKLSVEGQSSKLQDVVYVDDSNLYLVGFANNGTYNQSFVAKVDANGTFVPGFGTNGIYLSALVYENKALSGNINDAGEIQVVGLSDNGISQDVFVLTIQETSSTVPFASYLNEDISSNNDVAYSVASVSGGSLLVAGSAENGTDKDFLIMSLSSNGTNSSGAINGSLQAAGAVSAGYRISTLPITDITRVSVASGGIISQAEASALEITLRGIVYGIKQNPEYESTTDPVTTDSSATDSTTTSDGDTAGGVFPADRDSNYLVKIGFTEDGSGVGSYKSEVEDITPGTKYYLRAYAVLSDETVIYGNQFVFQTDDACFIATAAYGSILDKHVVILREFRDKILTQSYLGQLTIAIYYKYSPWLARIVEQHEILAAAVRYALVPVIGVAFLALKVPVAIAIVLFGVAFALIAVFAGRAREYYKNHEKWREAGFTLIELLVVLVIIGILAGYIGPKIMGRPEEAKRVKAGLQIQGLETALKMYKLDNGTYPTTEQGLQSLIEPPASGKLPPKWRDGGYLDKGRLPTDPWRNSFVYLSPGLNDDFDLTSYGGDGELGGEGDAQDINSWEIE